MQPLSFRADYEPGVTSICKGVGDAAHHDVIKTQPNEARARNLRRALESKDANASGDLNGGKK